MESILTAEAQERLDATRTLHPQHVNRAVSFNAIKHHALDLIYSDLPTRELGERLTALFLTSPVTDRPQRAPPRNNASDRALLDFQRRRKKHCY